MISSGSHCVATLICKGVRDRVREVWNIGGGETEGRTYQRLKSGVRKREREDVVSAIFRGNT